MTKTPFYERHYYFLSPQEFEVEFASNENIKTIAKLISPAFHEDWKRNLVVEKGKDYQHFRPCKNDELSQKIVDDFKSRKYNGEFCDAKSEDGKPLYKVEIVSGKEIGKLDLIRVPFEKLPPSWQDANLDAALFAVSLVVKYFSKYDHFTSKSFEALSSDIHEFWVSKNGYQGQKASLMLPYAFLPIERFQNNEKDKDRNHIILAIDELTNQTNVSKDSKETLLSAIEAIFGAKSCPTGLQKTYIEEIKALKYEIAERNAFDYGMKNILRHRVAVCMKDEIGNGLTPDSLTLEAFEDAFCAPYYTEWKTFFHPEILKKLDVKFGEIIVNNEEFNAKQFVREQVSLHVNSLAKEGKIDAQFATKVNQLFESEIPMQNKKDFEKFNSQSHVQE